jgi:hypothetical protein
MSEKELREQEDAELKAKFPDEKLTIIRVDGKKLVLTKPNRYVLSPCMAQINTDPVKALEELARAIVISEVSDMSILDDDDTFIAIMPALSGLVEQKKIIMTKLS